jgi:pilus assembly protein Flp/PilA
MALRVRDRRAPTDRPEETGQGMVEYGVIVALIAVAAMIAVQALGTGVAGVFTRVVGRITGIG